MQVARQPEQRLSHLALSTGPVTAPVARREWCPGSRTHVPGRWETIVSTESLLPPQRFGKSRRLYGTRRHSLSGAEHLFADLDEQLSRAAKLRSREAVAGLTAEAPGMVSTASEFVGRPAPPSAATMPDRP